MCWNQPLNSMDLASSAVSNCLSLCEFKYPSTSSHHRFTPFSSKNAFTSLTVKLNLYRFHKYAKVVVLSFLSLLFFLWPSYICLQKRCLRRNPRKIPNKKVASKSGPYVNSSDISILAEDMLVREIYRERARAKFTRLRGTFTFCIESSFATVFTKQSHHRSRIDLLSGVAEKASESSLHTAIPHAS